MTLAVIVAVGIGFGVVGLAGLRAGQLVGAPLVGHTDFLEDVEPEPWYGPTHRETQENGPGWLLPALIGTCVLALVLGAYGLGRLFSDKGGDLSPGQTVGERTPG